MPHFTKILAFTNSNAPDDYVIYVFKDDDGWFWLKRLVEEEGFSTPFSSVAEIEIYLDMPLTLFEETDREEWEKKYGNKT